MMAANVSQPIEVSNQLYCHCSQRCSALEDTDARQARQSETLDRDRHL